VAQVKIPLNRIENGKALREMLTWFRKTKKNGFAERFDLLWDEARKAAEKAGYGPEDVDRLVADARRAHGRA
jgi:hypothetical protein